MIAFEALVILELLNGRPVIDGWLIDIDGAVLERSIVMLATRISPSLSRVAVYTFRK
jgi:hypothetical protein